MIDLLTISTNLQKSVNDHSQKEVFYFCLKSIINYFYLKILKILLAVGCSHVVRATFPMRLHFALDTGWLRQRRPTQITILIY